MSPGGRVRVAPGTMYSGGGAEEEAAAAAPTTVPSVSSTPGGPAPRGGKAWRVRPSVARASARSFHLWPAWPFTCTNRTACPAARAAARSSRARYTRAAFFVGGLPHFPVVMLAAYSES